jgi:hypothetical protein
MRLRRSGQVISNVVENFGLLSFHGQSPPLYEKVVRIDFSPEDNICKSQYDSYDAGLAQW